MTNGTQGTAVVTNLSTGSFTYTPNANANGSDTFTFKANDGTEDSAEATVTVTITSVNDTPVASDASTAVLTGSTTPGILVATDVDSSSLTYAIVANGTKGMAVVTNAATGAYTYTPSPGATGVDSFTFKANDSALDSNVASVTVTIVPPPAPSTRLQGTVTDRASGQRLAGVKIYVHSATNTSVAATTDANGHYFLDGSQTSSSSGPITFQATGHFVLATTYTITAVPTTLDINLPAQRHP